MQEKLQGYKVVESGTCKEEIKKRKKNEEGDEIATDHQFATVNYAGGGSNFDKTRDFDQSEMQAVDI